MFLPSGYSVPWHQLFLVCGVISILPWLWNKELFERFVDQPPGGIHSNFKDPCSTAHVCFQCPHMVVELINFSKNFIFFISFSLWLIFSRKLPSPVSAYERVDCSLYRGAYHARSKQGRNAWVQFGLTHRVQRSSIWTLCPMLCPLCFPCSYSCMTHFTLHKYRRPN